MSEAADVEAITAAFNDDLANRTFQKMQVLHPTEFAHCLEAARVEILTDQLSQAHQMIEHLQSENTSRPAKKATTRRTTKTASSGKKEKS